MEDRRTFVPKTFVLPKTANSNNSLAVPDGLKNWADIPPYII